MYTYYVCIPYMHNMYTYTSEKTAQTRSWCILMTNLLIKGISEKLFLCVCVCVFTLNHPLALSCINTLITLRSIMSYIFPSYKMSVCVHMHELWFMCITQGNKINMKLKRIDEWVFGKRRLAGTEFRFAHWLKQNTHWCIADSYEDKHEQSTNKQ